MAISIDLTYDGRHHIRLIRVLKDVLMEEFGNEVFFSDKVLK